MRAGGEQGDRQRSVFVGDVEVAQATEVSDGDSTANVELVTADSVLDRWGGERRAGLESGLEGLKRSPTICRAGVEDEPGSRLGLAAASSASRSGGSARLCRRSGGDKDSSAWTRFPIGRAPIRARPGPCVVCR